MLIVGPALLRCGPSRCSCTACCGVLVSVWRSVSLLRSKVPQHRETDLSYG